MATLSAAALQTWWQELSRFKKSILLANYELNISPENITNGFCFGNILDAYQEAFKKPFLLAEQPAPDLAKLTQMSALNLDLRDIARQLTNLDFLYPFADTLTHLIIASNGIENVDFLAQLPQLQYLDCSNCSNIQNIGGLKFAQKLQHICITHNIATDFVDFAHCSQLREIQIYIFANALSLNGLQHCPTLQNLYISGDSQEIDAQYFTACVSLQNAELTGAHFRNLSADASRVMAIQTLKLYSPQLDNLDFLQSMPQLTTLKISSEVEVANLHCLKNCSLLTTLEMTLPALQSIEGIATCVALDEITLYDFPALTSLADLQALKKLRVINLCHNGEPITLEGDLNALQHCPLLEEIQCHNINISSFAALASLANVKALQISNCGTVDFAFLQNWANLDNINIENVGAKDLTFLQNNRQLTLIQITDSALKSLKGIEKCTNLDSLCIQDGYISDLSPLAACANLTEIYMDKTVGSLAPLASLTQLREFSLTTDEENPIAADISPLLHAPNSLQICNFNNYIIDDIQPFLKCTNLRELGFSDSVLKIDKSQADTLRAALPNCDFRIYPDFDEPSTTEQHDLDLGDLDLKLDFEEQPPRLWAWSEDPLAEDECESAAD